MAAEIFGTDIERRRHVQHVRIGRLLQVRNAGLRRQKSTASGDLMHHITARGTFLTSKACIPYLKKAANPHVLNMSPPLDVRTKYLGRHVAYTSAKLVMAMCTAGMAEEFRKDGIAFNSLWPRTGIATAAIELKAI